MRTYQNETDEKAESEEQRAESRKRPLSAPHSGFTLTELLVVITIIAILTSLVVAAAVVAMRRAKQARITLEIGQISEAMERFKSDYLAYPPNGVSNNGYVESSNDFLRMFKKAFPRGQEPEALIRGLAGDGTGTHVLSGGMNGAEAIFFWLGGFSSDPKYPISGPGGPSYIVANNVTEDLEGRNPKFEFDLGRLGPRQADGTFDETSGNGRFITWTSTYPSDPNNTTRRINLWWYHPDGSQQPYGYFDTSRHRAQVKNSSGNFVSNYDPWGGVASGTNFVYAIKVRNETNANRIEFANQGKFQLLHSGLDDTWGDSTAFSLGNKDSVVDPTVITTFPEGPFIGDIADTLTNFTTGTLEDEQE
jgi:prepilin-type N-terminal cleavage/methylation domain-containing protein